MHRLTRNLGTTHLNDDPTIASGDAIKRILVCRPNHRLGNLLLITPLLQEITATLPHVKIDLFVKGKAAPELFKHYPNVDRLIMLPKKPARNIIKYLSGWIKLKTRHYDIAINVVNDSSSGRLSVQFSNARYKFLGDVPDESISDLNDRQHIAKRPVYSFRTNIGKLGYKTVSAPVPFLNLKLTADEIEKGRKVLDALVINEKPTIGIYTYATGAKCYDAAWWEDFYARLVKEYPDFNIVEILPIENVSQIGGKAPSFYSRDLRELGGVIAGLQVFIGADSGMMHLASAAHAPVVGLFKADNMNTYAPYNNGSIGVNTMQTDMTGLLSSIDAILARSIEDQGAPGAMRAKPAF